MDTEPHISRRNLPHLLQFLLQSVAVFLVHSIQWAYHTLRHQPLPWPETSLLIGGVALLLASLADQSWWWRVIHTLFVPSICFSLSLRIAADWYLAVFVLLFLIYRGSVSDQVPLYLSNAKTAAALSLLVKDVPQAKIIDIGAGVGSVVRHLAKSFPDRQIDGAENALIPWLIGHLRTRGVSNCRWYFKNFWQMSLSGYDVVYAFLSPAPMTELWAKAQSEMPPGSLFITNSFPPPGIEADFVIDVGDSRKTQLFCYRIGTTLRQSNPSPRDHHHSLRST